MILLELEGQLYFTTDSLDGYTIYKNPDETGKSKVEFFGFNKAEKTVFIQKNRFDKNRRFVVVDVPEDIIDVYEKTQPEFDKYVQEWLDNPNKQNGGRTCQFHFAEQTDMGIVVAPNDKAVKEFEKLRKAKVDLKGYFVTIKTPTELFDLFLKHSDFMDGSATWHDNIRKDWDEFQQKHFKQLL